MVSVSGQMGVPVIVINGNVVVGFDRERIKALVSSGSKLRFGLKIGDASRITSQQGKAPVYGALVGEVAAGSIGERAGLKPGDIIIEVGDKLVDNAAELEGALGNLQAGNVVTFLFLRNGENRKSEIVL